MEIKISEVIRRNRKHAEISQEIFAEAMGVSVQAVSKWETGMSFPDITLLPRISEYFKISIDELFFGEKPSGISAEHSEIPDDGKLRIVQFLGSKMLKKSNYDRNMRIMLEIPESNGMVINAEIWGSADIDGDIGGNVSAGDGVNCGNIGENVSAGDGVNCGNVSGDVSAGDGVNCGGIGGDVSAGDGVNCGSIGGDVSAGDSVYCGSVGGDVSAGDSVQCGNIGRNVNAGCDINCVDIYGNAEAANGNIRCHEIKGGASCGGDIIYENH